MQYVVFIEGREVEVEIVEIGPERYQLLIDGRSTEVQARDISEETMLILKEHDVYPVEFEPTSDFALNMLVRDQVVSAEVMDLRQQRLRQAIESEDSLEGKVKINSPMAGKIIAIKVKPGDEVKKGQGLLIVEAMKMENELKAPKDGIVLSLNAEVNQAVDAGVLLCELE
jgi:biotin carboxyl carrier protein